MSFQEKLIWLDTDVGTDVDDATALLLLASRPDVELRCVSTVSGRTPVRAALAGRLLQQSGVYGVEVLAGLDAALPTQRFERPFDQGLWLGHEGKGVLSDEEIRAISADRPDPLEAVAGIARAVIADPRPVTLMTIGPCTNIAAVLGSFPEVKERICHHVAMGGVVHGPIELAGRALPPMYEYNFGSDREACARVLEAGLSTTLVPAELTYQTGWGQREVDELRGTGHPALQSLALLIETWAPVYRQLLSQLAITDEEVGGVLCHLHDSMTVLVMLQPELFEIQDVRLDLVEQEGSLATIVNPDGAFRVQVVVGADTKMIGRLVLDGLLSLA